ncbi:hypothetical protein [Hymenobacter sp. IS2118]|uniref:hypothetical protein n=1 Tax=Hymenobacter sp. IS2118 TaxID=1505605 RepID=UPI001268C579|nr:hypothetical protein [Hymenobacter sp. IS2118]
MLPSMLSLAPKPYLTLAALLLCTACSGEDATPQLTAAEVAVNQAVGTYACKAYFTSWSGGKPSITTRLRDTTILIIRVDTNTVQIGGTHLDVVRNPIYQGWRGHAPTRPATTFGNQAFGISTTYQMLQVASNSDSLYFENSGSGHSFGRVWKYYGKK